MTTIEYQLLEKTDVELLNMVAGTVVLTIENARYAKELKESYKEVLTRSGPRRQ